jgi:acyl-CoA synthetase (AMP-forming)/AMP-acid ligase II
VGEIVARGEQLFDGYYDDPQQTSEAFRRRDGWHWTGDLGYFDGDGFLTLVDRSKDMLVSGGENIYPTEIENALYRHEAVAECAVFGIPDERWGEVPAAHVVLAQGITVTEEELVSFCAAQIPRHKRPRLVKFVESLPRTQVGKIQKAVLRGAYWEGRARKI